VVAGQNRVVTILTGRSKKDRYMREAEPWLLIVSVTTWTAALPEVYPGNPKLR
jgi:hypothetical protein